jgi:hypothetical protein
MLMGIIMGSALALGVSLAMTGIVFLLLGDYSGRLASEHGPLLRGLAWSWTAAAVAVLAFYGELRQKPWRQWAVAAVLLLIVLLGVVFWPR